MPIERFKELHRSFHARFRELHDDPSTHIADSAFKPSPMAARSQRSYYDDPNTTPDRWDDPRKAAYLATYTAWVGAPRFSASGICVGDRYVHPDTGCMRALLAGNCVDFDENNADFVLTEKGRALIAPFHQIEDHEMEAA